MNCRVDHHRNGLFLFPAFSILSCQPWRRFPKPTLTNNVTNFSSRFKENPTLVIYNTQWLTSTAIKVNFPLMDFLVFNFLCFFFSPILFYGFSSGFSLEIYFNDKAFGGEVGWKILSVFHGNFSIVLTKARPRVNRCRQCQTMPS